MCPDFYIVICSPLVCCGVDVLCWLCPVVVSSGRHLVMQQHGPEDHLRDLEPASLGWLLTECGAW